LSCTDCPNPTITLPNDVSNVQVIFEGDIDNCTFLDTIKIEVLESGSVNITEEEIVACEGDLITLTAEGLPEDGTYMWSTGEESQSIDIIANQDTTISVEFFPANGCLSDNDFVEIISGSGFSIDSLIISVEGDTLYEGCEIIAEVEISPISILPDLTYQWFVNGSIVSEDSMLMDYIVESGELTIEVQVTFDERCDQSISVKRTVLSTDEIFIPNIFTPNGDRQNEFFAPIISPKSKLVDMKIFNRWGQVIYDNDSNTTGWNGKIEEETQGVDVFIYHISVELPNGQIVKRAGDVTLLR